LYGHQVQAVSGYALTGGIKPKPPVKQFWILKNAMRGLMVA
jgi:hypothetical protein